MAAWLDVVRFAPTAGGTTDWTYSSAVTGYQSPALGGVTNGRVYKYRAESADLTQWELGEGAYNTATGVLARTTVLYNSSGTGTAAGQSGAGTKISFSSAPTVAIVALKEDLIAIEEANAFTTAQKSQARSNIGMADGHIPGEPSTGTAAAGEIGEIVTSTFTTSVSGSNVATQLGTLVIPSAGEWEVEGIVNWSGGGATASTDYASIISTTSTPSVSAGNCIHGTQIHYRLPSGLDYALPMTHPPYKLSLAAGATIYLHGTATYSATPIPSGTGMMRARRSR